MSSPIIIFLVIFLLFAILRVPIFISICLGAMSAIWQTSVMKIGILPSAVFGGVDHFAFLAIPAFIYAGDLMYQGGVSNALLKFSDAVVYRVRGSLGAIVVITSMLFGSITGSSLATVTAIGGTMLPEMIKSGYKKDYAVALIAASGFLGILIPPSVPGVVYAITVGLPVADVWIATLGPGLLLGVMYIIGNYWMFGRKQPISKESFRLGSYFKGITQATPRALVALIMPITIFGGVYGGVFTPTEAGAAAVAYGLLAGWIIFPLLFHSKADKGVLRVTRDSAIKSASIMMLIGFASVVSQMIAYSGAPALLTEAFLRVTQSKMVFLLLVNILLIIVGMFLETNTSILLFAPILSPIADAFGVNPIHLAAIMLLNLEIGMITPPFAVNLFTACRAADMEMIKVLKPLMPFLLTCIAVLLVVTYCPRVALFFPNLFIR